jgi:hypothetical protein
MKIMKSVLWITPVTLLIAGCASGPVRPDPTVAEWERDGMLPWVAEWQSDGSERVLTSTGRETPQMYAYPASQPSIVVESDQSKNTPADLALADSIRQEVEYDRGLAPSLQRVIIEVRDGRVILRGAVKSDLDARVIVDNLRDIAGVSRVTNNLEISSAMD